jgi:putative transposase
METIATKPNEVWCWDITNMRSRTPGYFYKLYMFEDLFSRKVVGASVFEVEAEIHSKVVFKNALFAENITGKGLRLHADNGRPMRGINMLTMILSLGVRPSFSRPSVSNDNAHIEALFKTMKYTPMYPTKPFINLGSAQTWVKDFVVWYNDRLHSSLSYVSPNNRHHRVDEEILLNRRRVYSNARGKHPERWTTEPRSWSQPGLASLNPYGTRMVK